MKYKRKLQALALLVLCICLSQGQIAAKENRTDLVISAAASLQDSLQELKQMYEKKHKDIHLIFNFGSSGTLQKQIEQGAPVDLFVSAGQKQMQALADQNLVDKERITLLTNELVVVAPIDSKIKLAKSTCREFKKKAFKKIALGEPHTVPAGMYAKQVLNYLNIWSQLESKLVYAKDVRQVLTYVETGNVEAGFVYRTDALTSKKVKIILSIDPRAHESIEYPMGIIKESKHKEAAKDLFRFLQTKEAKAFFKKDGFKIPEDK